jgi:hypothetical protein
MFGAGVSVRAKLAEMTQEPWWSPSEICKVCAEPSEPYSTSFLCPRCRRIYEQGGPGLRKKEARFRAMCDQLNGEEKAFLCHFTGLSTHGCTRQPHLWDLGAPESR